MTHIDDLLGAELPSKAESSFKFKVKLLQDLTFPISKSKLTLGIEVNLVKVTLSIPSSKMKEILKECVEFRQRKYFTKRQLQSIIGKLMFVHKMVKPARLFVIDC